MPTYTGATALAPVTPDTARHFAAGALAMHDVFEFFATEGGKQFWRQWNEGETHEGTDGGTGRIVARTVVDTTRWSTFEFDGFSQADIGLDGSFVELVGPGFLRYSFEGFELTTLGVPLRLRGHIDLESSGGGVQVFWGTLRVTVTSGGRTWYTETLHQPGSEPTRGSTLVLAGDLFDAQFGRVSIASVAPVEYRTLFDSTRTPTYPFRGAMSLAGQGSAEFTLLNPHYHVLEFPSGTSGSAGPVTQRFTSKVLRTGAASRVGLEADAGPRSDIAIGDAVVADGRFSSAGAGLVRYEWTLLHGPPGASTPVGPTNHPTVTAGAGVAGDYLFALRATDGIDEAFDEVMIRVSEFGGGSLRRRWGGPSREVAVGEQVRLPRHRYLFEANPTPSAGPPTAGFLRVPFGSDAELENTDSDYPRFTPDIAGGYHFNADISLNRAARISAGVPLQVAPTVMIVSPYDVAGFEVADVSGDGRPDIVTTNFEASGSVIEPSVLLYRRLAGGVFAPAQMVDPAGAYAVVAVDFPASGRTGLVTILDDDVKPLVQTAGGDFVAGATVTLPPPDMFGIGMKFAVADFFDRGLPSIVVVHEGYDDLLVIDVQADDSLAAPRILAVDGKPYGLGSFEIVGARFLAVQHAVPTGSGTEDRFLTIFEGRADGGTDLVDQIASSNFNNNFAVADLGAGGGLELFLAADHALRRYSVAGDGRLSLRQSITLPGGGHSAPLLVGDFIGEGHKQVLYDRVNWTLHRAIPPDGTLDDGVPWDPNGRNLVESEAIDMNGDGIDDVVTPGRAAFIEYGRRAGR